MQIVTNAIVRSKAHNEIVRITDLEMAQAGVSRPAVCSELFDACENDVEANGWREFWGRDVDGNEWRVHVEGA